jgi:hypothetical protein
VKRLHPVLLIATDTVLLHKQAHAPAFTLTLQAPTPQQRGASILWDEKYHGGWGFAKWGKWVAKHQAASCSSRVPRAARVSSSHQERSPSWHVPTTGVCVLVFPQGWRMVVTAILPHLTESLSRWAAVSYSM